MFVLSLCVLQRSLGYNANLEEQIDVESRQNAKLAPKRDMHNGAPLQRAHCVLAFGAAAAAPFNAEQRRDYI